MGIFLGRDFLIREEEDLFVMEPITGTRKIDTVLGREREKKKKV